MHAKSNRIKTIIFSLVLLFGFTSCENFLKATDVKDEIENMIAYANAQTYEIRVECDEGTGSFIGSTIFKQKESDTFTVEFKIASGYYFTGWKIYSKSQDGTLTELSNEYLEILSFNTETTDGIYKATIKFHKAITNIVIKPQCILLPAVTSFSPSAGTQHYAFAPIQITFNQPVEKPETTEQTSLFKYGPKNISISVGSLSVTDCFKAPVLNASKTTLTLQPIYEKLIAFMGTSPYADVTVKFGEDITVPVGEISLPIVQNSNSTITVSYKNGKETDDPTLPDFLAAREEITDPTELPDLIRFSQKTYTGYNSFEYEDVIRNYVYNGIFYLWGNAYDEGSGVKSVIVTRKKTHLAEDVNDPVQESEVTEAYTAQNATFVDDGRGNTYFCIKYELEETGIYLFNVTVKDECENEVQAAPFSVIYKDNFFEEHKNNFSVWNKQDDNKLVGVYYGIINDPNTMTYTMICNQQIIFDERTGSKFYFSYLDGKDKLRFEPTEAGIDLYLYPTTYWFPAHRFDVKSVDDLPFTVSIVRYIENKPVILGSKDYRFPRKPIFKEKKLDGNYNCYCFSAPYNGYDKVIAASIYEYRLSSEPYTYSYNYYNEGKGLATALNGERIGPFTLEDLEAMAGNSSSSSQLQLDENSISITKSQKPECLDVTVLLDENWQNNYEKISLKCDYTQLQSDDDLGNYSAGMREYVNYNTIENGSSITLTLPTKVFYWYPQTNYTNAKPIELTLIAEKNGVTSVSNKQEISIPSEEIITYDNYPPSAKIDGFYGNYGYMTISFTDRESGVQSGKVTLNGKEYEMIEDVQTCIIPADAFIFGKNRINAYVTDNANNTKTEEFVVYYNSRTAAIDGVTQSEGKWQPNVGDLQQILNGISNIQIGAVLEVINTSTKDSLF